MRSSSALAGIPTDAFPDAEEECLSVTVEDALEQLWSIVEAAVERYGDAWPERVSVAVATFLAALDADPERAWLCLVEPLDDQGRIRQARTQLKDRLVVLLAAGDVTRDDVPPARTVAVGTVGSLWELAFKHVSGHDEDLSVDAIAESVTFLALAPRLGGADAMRAVSSASRPTGISVAWPPHEGAADD